MPQPSDRRSQERIQASADATCTFVSPVVTDFGAAKIKDLSLQGIGLTLSRKVEVGTTLVITLSNAAKSFTKTVLVQVVHVTPHTGGTLIGGTFTVPLTYEELTTLVM